MQKNSKSGGDFFHRFFVEEITAEADDGSRGVGDDAAALHDLDGAPDLARFWVLWIDR